MNISPELVGWIAVVTLFAMLGLGVPVAFTLTGIGFFGYLILAGSGPSLGMVGLVPYAKTALYAFTAVPLFIAMGNLAFYAGFGSDLYDAARKWVGRFPGGLAQATVVGGAAFGAACGSGLAGCAMLTKIAVPEMIRHGYDKRLAIGCAGSAGPIAQMIPPSIMFVLYGIITEQSVAKLLIAGIIPGIICAIIYMITIYIWVRINPKIAPEPERVPWKEAFISVKKVWGVAILALIVMGGIYSGVFTPTEAAGVGAFGTLILGLVARRIAKKNLSEAFLDTAKSTSMLYLILAGAYIFGYLLAITKLPFQLADFLSTLPVSRYVILFLVMIFYIIIGCLIDMVPAMFVTLPMIFPTIMRLEFNPIWFGVLVVQLGEISLLTPPFGLNLFLMKGLMPEVEMDDIIRGVFPFIIAAIFTLFVYIIFPQTSLFLPNLMMGK